MPQCPTCQAVHGAEVLLCPTDGTVIGGVLDQRYQVISLLGQGGMGAVYLAEHVAIRKKVALKVLHGELSHDPSFARRFELEAIAASRIGHESIVNVTDFGRTPEGALYSVMEYLEGETLSDLMTREGRLPVPRAIALVIRIARALEAAHAHGIVHRDLKPQNVMILKQPPGGDAIKLLDFGISKLVGEGAEKITGHGQILGTAEYIAPEQVTAGPIDARADVYSLGVVTHELLTGKLPLRASSTVAMLLQHVQTRPARLRESAPGLQISAALEDAVFKALSKKRDHRQASMGELIAELEQATGGFSEARLSSLDPMPELEALRPKHVRRVSIAAGILGIGVLSAWALFQSSARVARTDQPSEPQVLSLTPKRGIAEPKAITVRSTPDRADVYDGNAKLGVTPLELKRPNDTASELRLELAGYQPTTVRLMPGQEQVEVKLAKDASIPQNRPHSTKEGRSYSRVNNLKPPPF